MMAPTPTATVYVTRGVKTFGKQEQPDYATPCTRRAECVYDFSISAVLMHHIVKTRHPSGRPLFCTPGTSLQAHAYAVRSWAPCGMSKSLAMLTESRQLVCMACVCQPGHCRPRCIPNAWPIQGRCVLGHIIRVITTVVISGQPLGRHLHCICVVLTGTWL